jgi:uncharacterized protein
MHIWVDGDACPAVIKDILYRAAERAKVPMTLVANKLLRTPRSPYIRALQVPRGIDVADSHIVRELAPGDLVITADIPLASDVIGRGAHALNPRGEFYSAENIQERLALRNYLDELRGMGERTGGPAALDNTDRKRFADQLDRFLTRQKR